MQGSLAVVVKSGTIFAHVDKVRILHEDYFENAISNTFYSSYICFFQLTEDSFLEVESGDITLTLSPSFPFR